MITYQSFWSEKNRNKIEKHLTTGRSYIRYDKENFKNVLSMQDWIEFDETNDVDVMWDLFEHNIRTTLDVTCPIRDIRVSDTKPQWLSNEIIQLMRKRDTAYKKARLTKNQIDWRKATFLRNRVEFYIKDFKSYRITGNLNRYANNPSKFWKELRKVVPKGSVVNVSSLIDEKSGQVHSDKQLSEYVNKYFANVGKELANNIIQNRTLYQSIGSVQTVVNAQGDGIMDHDFTME